NYRVAVQTPPDHIDSVDALLNTPIINSQAPALGQNQIISGEIKPRPPQLLSNLVDLRRTVSPTNLNHYNVQPVYDVYANVQRRDLAAVAADVKKAIDAVRPELPKGSSIVIRGQVQTMNSS